MRAFVTGGTGFVGSHLVDALLLDEETEVRCLVRKNPKWLEGKKVTQVQGDLHDIEALKKGIEGCEFVFHSAAATAAPDERSFMARNVEGTENVLRIAQKAGVKNLIVLSSLAAAGPTQNGQPISEDVPCRPVSLYGKSKMRMEQMLQDQADSDQKVSIIRPPAVYGPREENIYSLFKSASRGIAPIVGDGNRPRVSLVHVRDLIRGILLAADKSPTGVHKYFIASDQIYTWNQVTDILSALFGKKLWRPKVDPQMLKRISGLFESFGSLTGKTPMLNKDKAKELSLEWLCSIEKAKKELGFVPKVDLQRGFYETLTWYKAHFWL